MDALDAVELHEFDIILMDLQMPLMDGIETSRRIRASANGNKNAFIVALTASYLPEKGHELFTAGMDNYIAKPFEVEHLRQILDFGFDHRRSRYVPKPPVSLDPVAPPVHRDFDAMAGIRMVGGDKEIYQELLADFVDKLPEKNKNIEKLFDEKDLKGLSRIAHNIKGISLNLGALQLSEYADKLEKSTYQGYTDVMLESIVRDVQEISRKFIADANDFLAMTENETNVS